MIKFMGKLFGIFNRKSVLFTMSISFVCLITLVIFILGIVSYFVTSEVVKDNSGDYVGQLVERVNYNIRYYIENVEAIKTNISYDLDIQNYLEGKGEVDQEELQAYLNNFVNARRDIANIFIVTEDDRIISNDGSLTLNDNIALKEQEWYNKAMNSDQLVVSTSRIQNMISGEYNWVISCSSSLLDPKTGEKLGVLLIDLNFKFIDDLCSGIKLGNKGYLFILDEQGDLVYHPKQQLIYSSLYEEPIDELLKVTDGNILIKFKNKKAKQYTISSVDFAGWRIIGAVYVEDLLAYSAPLQRYFILSAFIAIIFTVILTLYISKQILNPLKELLSGMRQMKKGDFSIQVPVDSENEIARLGHSFNSMARKTNELIIQIRHEQEQKRKNELKALQAQINPHFLYNTLDSIIWMAELKDYKSVKLMTSALAKLFRIGISKGREVIPIREEMEHIKNYLKIQEMRYSEQLDYDIFIEESIYEFGTVKLILQPIVENAIYHGVKYKQEVGHITIKGLSQEEDILFIIEDDGVGMTEEQLAQVMNKESKSGVGMSNVDERIRLYFGEDYGIQIESEMDEGTRVTIRIPQQRVGEGGAVREAV